MSSTKRIPPTRDMNTCSPAEPDAHHRHLYEFLGASSQKALAYILDTEANASSADAKYSQAVKPAAVGRHMLDLDQHEHRVNRMASPEGLKHLRMLAAHRIVYDAGIREGWRLTPFGRLVARCAPKPAVA